MEAKVLRGSKGIGRIETIPPQPYWSRVTFDGGAEAGSSLHVAFGLTPPDRIRSFFRVRAFQGCKKTFRVIDIMIGSAMIGLRTTLEGLELIEFSMYGALSFTVLVDEDVDGPIVFECEEIR